MSLVQDGYNLKGKCNDAFGEFFLSGSLDVTKIAIMGKRNDDKRDFQLSAELTGENDFSGTFTTNQNTTGTLTAHRISNR